MGGKRMVQEIVDKGILWICGLAFVGMLGSKEGLVVASLCAVGIALAANLRWKIPYLQEILTICFLLAGFQWMVCLPFFPLVNYDAVKKKQYVLVAISGAALGSQGFFESDTRKKLLCAYVLVLMCVSLRLAIQTRARNTMEVKLKQLRDDSMENALLLKERNRSLLQQQNTEIHMATLKERNRIAREIHDNVGHMLTRAILQTGALKVLVKEEPLKGQVEGLHETLNIAMNNIRESVHDLHDESIDLEKAVKELIVAFSALEIKFSYAVDKSVDNQIKYGFIAIIKEALNNTAKHSNGNLVTLRIVENPGFYQLVISDNGRDIEENFTGGMGLSGIRERVDNLGGTLTISTENGFRINVVIMK